MRQPGYVYFGVVVCVVALLHAQRRHAADHLWIAFVFYPPLFTLQEYVAHRFFLHGFASRTHAGHHRHSSSLTRIFVPIPVSLCLALSGVLLCRTCLTREQTLSVVMSMLLGYLAFEFVHYAAHKPQDTVLFKRLRQSHLAHHVRPHTNFGFVSVAWDIVFGTYGDRVDSLWLRVPYPILPFALASSSLGELAALSTSALPLLCDEVDEHSYRSYHTSLANRAVHVVCIPVLVWSLLALLGRVPVANGVTMAHVASAVYCGRTGHLAVALWMMCLAHHVSRRACSVGVAIAVHMGSWVVQIVLGHGMFEGRRPALWDGTLQALCVAPMVATQDVFHALGEAVSGP